MKRQTIHEQAAAYALDTLDEDERAAFERHLAGCEECQDELSSFQDVAADLALAVEGRPPPAELRERILEGARSERPKVVPLRPRRLLARPAVWVAAAAACAAIGLGIWGGLKAHSLSSERDARRAQEQALVILADPDATRTALTGAQGTLAVRPDGEAALAVQLDRAPSGRTYEAWVIAGGKNPRPAGLFGGGGAASAFALQRPVPAGATVAVTIERKGGVVAPTSRPIFSASRPTS